MAHKLLPSLLLSLSIILLIAPATAVPKSLSPLQPKSSSVSQHLPAYRPDDETIPTTGRRVFATARVFNIIVRYRRFAPLALNADRARTAEIRAALVSCQETLQALQSDDNARSVRTLLSGLVLLLDWLICLLN